LGEPIQLTIPRPLNNFLEEFPKKARKYSSTKWYNNYLFGKY